MNTNFRMNWHDFKEGCFVYNREKYHLYTRNPVLKIRSRARVFFFLNIHRGYWVDKEDIINFVYGETNPDIWTDWQESSVITTIFNIRNRLPKGVRITNNFEFGYCLEVD